MPPRSQAQKAHLLAISAKHHQEGGTGPSDLTSEDALPTKVQLHRTEHSLHYRKPKLS